MWGIHRWPVNSPQTRSVMREMFPFDDVIVFHDSPNYTFYLFPTSLHKLTAIIIGVTKHHKIRHTRLGLSPSIISISSKKRRHPEFEWKKVWSVICWFYLLYSYSLCIKPCVRFDWIHDKINEKIWKFGVVVIILVWAFYVDIFNLIYHHASNLICN